MINMRTYASREEWLTARTSMIGGSDASCILGANPWKKNTDLWDEKMGIKNAPDISNRESVAYGTNAEKHLRELFKLDHPELDVMYEEHNMWTNDTFPFAHASLDGWIVNRETGEAGVWECKTTTIQRQKQWEEWDGKLPNNYYAQVIHYLAVTGKAFAILTAQIKYTKDGNNYKTTREYLVRADDPSVAADMRFLMSREEEFYNTLMSGKRPATLMPFI